METTAVSDYDDFYADTAAVRDVSTFETYFSISVNEPICFFGRKSNTQDCSLNVQTVGAQCSVLGTTVKHMVMMNGFGVADYGDSGGPWFTGNKAYGLTSGGCYPSNNNNLTFTSIYWSVEALGVEIVCGLSC